MASTRCSKPGLGICGCHEPQDRSEGDVLCRVPRRRAAEPPGSAGTRCPQPSRSCHMGCPAPLGASGRAAIGAVSSGFIRAGAARCVWRPQRVVCGASVRKRPGQGRPWEVLHNGGPEGLPQCATVAKAPFCLAARAARRPLQDGSKDAASTLACRASVCRLATAAARRSAIRVSSCSSFLSCLQLLALAACSSCSSLP
jgi:hypothetical protein